MTNLEYRDALEEGKLLYTKAKENNLTNKNRWEDGIEHHPMSVKLMKFLELHDLHDYNDYFC